MSQSTADIPGTTTSLEEQHTVEQFLYREARMLDDRLYMDWLGLLTDDCTYRVPIRENVQAVRGKPAVTIEDELSGLAYFDDDKLTLTAKALRLGTGTAWGENPPSRTRRMVSNVEVTRGEKPDELLVHSNLVLYRSRRADEVSQFVGQRRDMLRRTDKGLMLARRVVVLDMNICDSSHMGNFF
ncbi:MAG: 3-phenylpropionate/cinnamic acid dioxygenase subunit beta [bacterium]|jgi:biphenyl 2,3-dioxygenase beta subunit|nr:benzene 1,2-dioxygenase [Deltaproteobacteria bacterium]MCP4245341.1 3-phenylpropionate/cinnamic acid dioxygenase subunit beta [bacterium]MDP7074440.1 3-phenylpropionate/cinnamic acid dioxygenase subunit beta [Myxococcota bacterium]MCP5068722.1 3-phenylpropionate/cinnamic acid dioxygenase subunit beta [bacterium]MDP7571001.1 3-phenylpropionate/cinnamic acid dioxygenase subunit beta [Myxococcota bacterium]